MAAHIDQPLVLMIRPWLGLFSAGCACAHIDAIVMRRRTGLQGERYGDYTVLTDWPDGKPRTPCLYQFQVQCRTDSRNAEAYAWQERHQSEGVSILGARGTERHGPPPGTIKHGLDRTHSEDGPAEGVGGFVVSRARVLKLDAIVLLETSQTGSFSGTLETGRKAGPGNYGQAIRDIDTLVLDLHQACARRAGKVAA